MDLFVMFLFFLGIVGLGGLFSGNGRLDHTNARKEQVSFIGIAVCVVIIVLALHALGVVQIVR